MTVRTAALTIGTTPVLVNGTEDSELGQSLTIYNGSSAVIYLGGADVTTATGFPIPAGGTYSVSNTNETFYLVAGSAGITGTRVIREGVA